MNTGPQDTEHQAAVEIARPSSPRRSDDPQAVEVEASGISAADSVRRKRSRNIAIALALAAFVVLIFVITIVKLGGNVMNRPL